MLGVGQDEDLGVSPRDDPDELHEVLMLIHLASYKHQNGGQR